MKSGSNTADALTAIYEEINTLDIECRLTRADYDRLYARARAITDNALDLRPVHKAAARAGLVSTLDLYPTQGAVGRPLGSR